MSIQGCGQSAATSSVEQRKDSGPIAPSPFLDFNCERQDSNLHPLRDWILNPARLPIPPLSPVFRFLLFYSH